MLRAFIPVKLTTQRKTQSNVDSGTVVIERPCPVCGNTSFTLHWQKDDLRVVRCADCSMVFANPAPSDMASGAFYSTEGAEYYLCPTKLASDYAEVRFERELKLFREFCSRGAVLDVGCGSGAFLFQLKQRWPDDYEVLGTDVSGAPLNYAASRGVPVVGGAFLSGVKGRKTSKTPAGNHSGADDEASSDVGGVTTSFDAVTIWAVLEHLAEPKDLLDRTRVLLKPGGHCYVLVPNVNSLAMRLLGLRYRYVYPQHLNYFSLKALSRLCASARFQIVATRFTHFNPIVIWQDWRSGGQVVSNRERAALLQRTTAYKERRWLAPVKWLYRVSERLLAAMGFTDNLALVLRKE